jgi:hypothetical protein
LVTLILLGAVAAAGARWYATRPDPIVGWWEQKEMGAMVEFRADGSMSKDYDVDKLAESLASKMPGASVDVIRTKLAAGRQEARTACRDTWSWNGKLYAVVSPNNGNRTVYWKLIWGKLTPCRPDGSTHAILSAMAMTRMKAPPPQLAQAR